MTSSREGERNPAIGIDLGTTNCCVAVLTRSKIKIIPNEQGKYVTPSYVSFTPTEQLIGYTAKTSTDLYPTSTIFDVKRIIGRNWKDVTIQHDMENWPFKLVDVEDVPHIEVEIKGERKLFLPEQISAMLVKKLKDIAEDYLKRSVTSAVITVPAYFNDAQRQATIDAGRIAGLTVLKIINEPTAAAIAYAYRNHDLIKEGTNILVFDFGGGTLDVTILKIEKDAVTVRATNGNTHLGGEDVNCRLVDYCVETFHRKFNYNLRNDVAAIRRLRSECERVKKDLSHDLVAKVNVYRIHKDIDFSFEISRARFEQLNGDLIRQTLIPVDRALKDAELQSSDINKVILVGGSTRIPLLKTIFRNKFGSQKISDNINVDTTVAYGAAIQAAVLSGKVMPVWGRHLKDVTPLSLGTDSEIPPSMSIIIPRNTIIPAERTVTYSTVKDNQHSIRIQIRQGESKHAHENYLIDKFELTGFPKSEKGVPWIDVTFRIDENGVLIATAIDKTSGSSNSIRIDKCNGRLKKKKIDALIEQAQDLQRYTQKQCRAKKAAVALEDEVFSIKRSIENYGSSKEKILKVCDEELEWVEAHPNETEKEYQGRKKVLSEYARKFKKSGSFAEA